MSLPVAASETELSAASNPWLLPERTLTVMYGTRNPALSHYFFPRILLNQKPVLHLDGANQISPLLIARFARERGLEPSEFTRVARAFTCFQLTELIRRVPKILATCSADVLIATVLPDLFFDEDVRDPEARASFEHVLEGLWALAPLPLSIAVFSDATCFKTKKRDCFEKLRNQADHVVKVILGPGDKLAFTCKLGARLTGVQKVCNAS